MAEKLTDVSSNLIVLALRWFFIQQIHRFSQIFLGLFPLAIGLVNNSPITVVQAQTLDSLPDTFEPTSPLPLPPLEKPTPLPPPTQLLKPSPPQTTPQEELPLNIPGQIVVEQFKFVGNTAFSAEQLAAVTAPLTKRPISFSELLQARSAVTQLYLDNGYVTSGAYIPPQTIEGGVVTIKIVEGGIEAINVKVEGRLDANYVRERVALGAGTPLNTHRLLEALRVLQLNPLIENLSAELSAGTRPGTSILEVNVKTARTFKPQIQLDNARNPSVGSFRRGGEISEANVFGIGDSWRGAFFNSDGTNDFQTSYKIPVNALDGSFELGYRTVSGRVIAPPVFVPLDIRSYYQQVKLSFRQPLVQTVNEEFALGLILDRQENTSCICRFFPVFPFPGANNQGQTIVSTLRFFQEWRYRSEEDVVAARSEFNFGLPIFGSTSAYNLGIDADALHSRFFMWRAQAQWVHVFAPDTLMLIRGDLQLSDRPIVPLERYSLGGLGNVEGYPLNTVLSDNAFFTSLEFRFPLWRDPKKDTTLQIVPFFQFGTGWNSGSSLNLIPQINPNTLAALGLGLQLQVGSRVSARLDWGIPLIPFVRTTNDWQEHGIFFTLILSP